MTCILIFMRESKVGQIIAMILTSIAWLNYIIQNQPFEEPGLNKLEIFNEAIILTCLYHLLMFTQGLSRDLIMIYKVGWSMDILLMLQFSINIILLAFNFTLKIRSYLRRQYRLHRLKQEKEK
jgi:hypothetical protein